MWCRNRFLGALLALAVCSPAAAQGIVVPNTFTNGTTADADQVNANFAALVNNALNRAGGIMSGSLQTIDVLPVTTDVSDIGTNLKKYRDGWFSRNVSVGGTFTATGLITGGASMTVTGAVGMTTFLSVGTSASIGTTLGVGIAVPTRQVHFFGIGQTTAALTDAGATGGTLYLQDAAAVAGNGGAVLFGASQGYFAAIKSLITDGTPNTIGALAFATRTAIGNVALTEAMRISPSGGLGIGTNVDPGVGGLLYAGMEGVTGGAAILSPAAIGADQADYTPAGIATARVLRITPSGAPRAVTGLFPLPGHFLTIVNGAAIGSGLNLVLGNLTVSTAAYQFAIRGAANLTIEPGASADAFYDNTLSRWSVH